MHVDKTAPYNGDDCSVCKAVPSLSLNFHSLPSPPPRAANIQQQQRQQWLLIFAGGKITICERARTECLSLAPHFHSADEASGQPMIEPSKLIPARKRKLANFDINTPPTHVEDNSCLMGTRTLPTPST